jgi:hypothetical protein
MNKYHVTLYFRIEDDFMEQVPMHRAYINDLIKRDVIDYYSVSIESSRGWIVMNATSKENIMIYLEKSPLARFWTVEIDELFIYDGQHYRLPALKLN